MPVTNTTLFEGNNRIDIHITNDGDAETDVVKIDRSAIFGPGGWVEGALGSAEPGGLSLMYIEWSVSGTGGEVRIEWDRTGTDDVIMILPADSSDERDFRRMGGKHDPDPTDGTGDIIVTCVVNTIYDIRMQFKKKD